MHYVLIQPPLFYCGRRLSALDVDNSRHRKDLWVGQVVLFFHATVLGKQTRKRRLALALVSCLYDLTIPEIRASPPKEERFFYVPDKAWTIVVPVRNILGRAPLMRCYLEGGQHNTIPHSMAAKRERYFAEGHADRSGAPGTGSKVFEFNWHMWRWGRPAPGGKDGRSECEEGS